MAKKTKRSAKKKRKATMLPPQHEAQAPSLAALVADVPSPAPALVAEEHRESLRTSLAVELHMSSESHFFTGLSGDISEGGLFVSTYRALKAGAEIDLEFSLPGSSAPLQVRGTVRWHRNASPDAPPGVGIAFDDLSEDDRDRIHRFCSVRPPLYYEVA